MCHPRNDVGTLVTAVHEQKEEKVSEPQAFWEDHAAEMASDAEYCALFLESLALVEALDGIANAPGEEK